MELEANSGDKVGKSAAKPQDSIYRKITGRGFMMVCHNKQRLYVNMISKSC